MAQATFPLIPRRRVIGLAFGSMRSARRGLGSDVASSRPYRPGDRIDSIDWAASARLSLARNADEFVVREHYAEESPRALVLADRRPSLELGPPPARRLRKAAALEYSVGPFADPLTGAVTSVRLGWHEAAELRESNERRWRTLLADFRSVGLEPVVVDSHEPAEISAAFLRWADERIYVRGRS